MFGGCFVFFQRDYKTMEARLEWCHHKPRSHQSWKSLQREHGHADTLISDFWLQNCKRISVVLTHQSCGSYSSLRKLTWDPNKIYKLPLVIISLKFLSIVVSLYCYLLEKWGFPLALWWCLTSSSALCI